MSTEAVVAVPEPSSGTGTTAMSAVSGYFERLGDTVERLWAPTHNNEHHFPAVAARALEEVAVPEGVDALSVLEFLTSARRLPSQEKTGFGQPPVTLYRSRDFYISALYWLDGTTSIHQHAFSGAFRVLVGSSIHVGYHFSCQETVTRRLLFGDLKRGEVEVLRCGDIREIEAGGDFIHALFHLDRPSVTVVVRTNAESLGTPQFNYHRPGVGFDQFFEDKALTRRLQGLDTMRSIAPDEALRCAIDLVCCSDLFRAFLVVHFWFLALERGEHFDELLDHLIRHHGSSATPLVAVFEDLKRESAIVLRRRLVHATDHRLFLALLLNLPDRSAVDTILGQLFPEQEPGSLLARWVSELASPALRSVSGLQLADNELAAVCTVLEGTGDHGGEAEGLRGLAGQLRPPPLLDHLFR